MPGVYAPNGSKNVTVVSTEASASEGQYAPDGSTRITIVGYE